jgi:hypothetical protein
LRTAVSGSERAPRRGWGRAGPPFRGLYRR